MCKHRGGFPEGQSPIVLDTLSNAEYITRNMYSESLLISNHVFNSFKLVLALILRIICKKNISVDRKVSRHVITGTYTYVGLIYTLAA